MTIYDISHSISSTLPVWPGDPSVELDWVGQIGPESDANISRLRMCVHSGTHVDAPLHYCPDGGAVDSLELRRLLGTARLIAVEAGRRELNRAYLQGLGLAGLKRVIFRTRPAEEGSRQWTFSEDFVALSADGASYLTEIGVELFGIDSMSVALFNCGTEVHRILLKAGVVLLEGLNLAGVPVGDYLLIALPLKLAGRDGAPMRALLLDKAEAKAHLSAF